MADLEAPGLVIRCVRRRRDLAVALLRWEPGLDVVLLRRRCAEVAGGDVDDAVRELEFLYELLFDVEQPVVLLARPLRSGEDKHLDLVPLMDAEHPARALAVRAGFTAEARRVPRVAQRQMVGVQDLRAVHRGERNL